MMTTKAQYVAKAAASTLVLASMLAACKPAATSSGIASVSAAPARQAQSAAKNAEQASRAIAKRDYEAAIPDAESAVAAAPLDAGYRLALANAYLGAGRFTSARQSFEDALAIAPGTERARIGIAMSAIGAGDNQTALDAVREGSAFTSVADRGLAMALAGDAKAAIQMLEDEARSPMATPRLRQNLALAHALAGQWDRALAVAAQDLSGETLKSRMRQWAALTSERDSRLQIAQILNVTHAASDAGRPVALALAAPVEAPVALAEAPVAAEVAATPAPAPVAPATIPVQAAIATTPAPEPVTAPASVASVVAPEIAIAPVAPRIVLAAMAPPVLAPPAERTQSAAVIPDAPIRTPAPVADAIAMPAAVTAVVAGAPETPGVQRTHALSQPMTARIREASFAAAPGGGRWVIQLAAYSSHKRLESGWAHVTGRFDALSRMNPALSTVTVNGRTLHRLAVSGFASRRAASTVCGAYRSRGGDCFVRSTDGDAPLHMARAESRPEA
jgi:Flp pilus assembly protein TadD